MRRRSHLAAALTLLLLMGGCRAAAIQMIEWTPLDVYNPAQPWEIIGTPPIDLVAGATFVAPHDGTFLATEDVAALREKLKRKDETIEGLRQMIDNDRDRCSDVLKEAIDHYDVCQKEKLAGCFACGALGSAVGAGTAAGACGALNN